LQRFWDDNDVMTKVEISAGAAGKRERVKTDWSVGVVLTEFRNQTVTD
jgi:hypothetical protein